MKLIINLSQRLIRAANSGVKLLFSSDDSFFYLQIVALIAQKMKEQSKKNSDKLWVPISEIEDTAWSFSRMKPKPFKSKQSMKVNIYQTWRGRLAPKNERCIYQVEWVEGKPRTEKSLRELAALFKIESGKGPGRATYKINMNPSSIEIVNEASRYKNTDSLFFDLRFLKSTDDKKKVQFFIDVLYKLTTPQTYRNVISDSCDAMNSLLMREEMRRVGENGILQLSIEDYADAYVELLGVVGVRGAELMPSWLEQLEEDPWWIEIVFPGSSNPLPRLLPDECIPLTMADRCHRLGDMVSLLWLFHRAYINSVVTVNRDKFLSSLKNQNEMVRKQVYMDWVKRLSGTDYMLVGHNPIRAFKDLQKITLTVLRYSK